MLESDRSILVYGLKDEELEKLKKANLNIIKVTPEMAFMKVKDILNGENKTSTYDNSLKGKLIVFNNYSGEDLPIAVKVVRGFVRGGILASVTPMTREWTFKYLLEHLIEERNWIERRREGR